MQTPSVFVAFVATLVFWASRPASAADECMARPNEHSIRECLDQAYATEERSLETVLSQTNASADQQRRSLLAASENAWAKYRDDECRFQGDGFRGGTLEADQATECLIVKDDARVHEVKNDLLLAAH